MRHTAVAHILRAKLPRLQDALDAYEESDLKTLEELGENDLLVRELRVMAGDEQAGQ